eukprot:TRINITY_DN10961_c0_g1_i1.p1 TRINITY_DN10961_c0_g1~~TRINITY_DN10961_c0_g1_i1.p1  ORF type:complete len:451 (-),score=92.63 TRINITY_DN10961_c0_g1_i1:390-1742(-)
MVEEMEVCRRDSGKKVEAPVPRKASLVVPPRIQQPRVIEAVAHKRTGLQENEDADALEFDVKDLVRHAGEAILLPRNRLLTAPKTTEDLKQVQKMPAPAPVKVSQSASPLLERRRLMAESKSPGCSPRLVQPPKLQLESVENKDHGYAEALKDRYELLEVLGSGSTSTVQRAIRRSDDRRVALKIMRAKDSGSSNIAKREFDMMKKLAHPNIIRTLSFHVFDSSITSVLVMEHFQGQSLDEALQQRPYYGRLSEALAQTVAAQLYRAVGYLIQTHEIIHRDIKPQNILVSSDCTQLKLIDFNNAAEDDGALTPAGTVMYMAPEVLSAQPSTAASDVWAAGMCVYFSLAGHLPQRRDRCSPTRAAILEASKTPATFTRSCWRSTSDTCKAFLAKALNVEPSERPSIAELLEEPWISEVPELRLDGSESSFWLAWVASLVVPKDLQCSVRSE